MSMMPFRAAMFGGASATSAATAWRIAFPDGGTIGGASNGVNVAELAMFENSDGSGADLTEGLTPTASSEEASFSIDGLNDNDINDVWRCATGSAIGAWAEVPVTAEVASFTLSHSQLPWATVALQRVVGGNVTTVLEYDTSDIDRFTDDRRTFLFSDDGYVKDTHQFANTTGQTGQGGASKGAFFTANTDLEVTKIRVYIAGNNNDYKIILAFVNGSNSITSIEYDSGVSTLSTTGYFDYTISVPLVVASGQKFCVLAVRDGDGNGSVCELGQSNTSSMSSTGLIGASGSIRWSDQTPSVGETPVGGGARANIELDYRFGFVP